jgi:two-component system nitrate/nitrite response regulator NarL
MSLIGVALVGGSTLHREGLRQSLDQSRFAIVAEGRDFSSIVAAVSDNVRPQLVVADFSRQCERDFDGLHRLRDAAPDCRIVVLSNELNFSDLARVLRAGADGYLVTELSREAFSLSLLVVMSGEKVLPGSLADVLASNYREFWASRLSNGQASITDRERQILQCLLSGYSNKLIARVLDITEGTVKVHLKTLMKKISAVNRTQAALWARSHGIGEDPDVLEAQQAHITSTGKNTEVSPPLPTVAPLRQGNGNRAVTIGASSARAT